MGISIIAFIIFIVATVVYIVKTYSFLIKESAKYSWLSHPIPKQIIRTYNMETMFHKFVYSNPSSIDQLYYAPSPMAPIMTIDRLEYEKKRVAEKIGRELLDKGFIEVRERPSMENPFMNEVAMRVRVYSDGAVAEKHEY